MKIAKGIFAITNLFLIIATLGAYLAASLSPALVGIIPSLGLIFAALILGNVIAFLIAVCWQPKWAMASLLTLFLGFPYIKNTIAFAKATPNNPSLQTIQVGTYNMQFSKPIAFLRGAAQQKKIAQFNAFLEERNHLDILGVQECGWRTKERIEATMDFPYQHFIPNTYAGIYSKHPIVNKGVINFSQPFQKCLWADIVIQKDTIRFYTTRLAPNRFDGKIPLTLDQEAHENIGFKKMVGIFLHYQPFTLERVKEAALIRAHQQTSPYPSIISGDLNDVPQTFMYATITADLKDTFLEAGKGFGGTHGGPIPSLRIDYILVDQSFKVRQHQILTEAFSDHYMLEATLQY